MKGMPKNCAFLFQPKDSPNLQTQRDVNIRLEDVNDNVPKLMVTRGFVCANHPQPVTLIAEDKDGPPFGQPLTFAMSKKAPNWEIRQTDGRHNTGF